MTALLSNKTETFGLVVVWLFARSKYILTMEIH